MKFRPSSPISPGCYPLCVGRNTTPRPCGCTLPIGDGSGRVQVTTICIASEVCDLTTGECIPGSGNCSRVEVSGV